MYRNPFYRVYYNRHFVPIGGPCSTLGVGCVTMTCCGASMKEGTSGGVNTGGAEPGGVSSPFNNIDSSSVILIQGGGDV